MVVEMTVTADGSITDTDLYRALVFNHAKLAYNDVSDWLDGNRAPPAAIGASPELQQQVQLQEAASSRLRKVRYALGAMSLETTQAETVVTNGGLSDLRPATKNRAKELIEDQMIAANGVTARFLKQKGRVSIRRVLQTPRRWDRIVALAASHGERLPDTPDVVALADFLQRRRKADPAHYADISLSVIKMLGSGEYGLDVPGKPAAGHFGLAVSDYAHSTAPNRRFPDLVTQRLVKAALAGDPAPYSEEELGIIARHCTEREDDAGKVERQVRKSAAAMLLESQIGREFDAIVTGAADKGTWVRINHPVAEGKVVRNSQGLDVGDRVRVTLLRVDIERGFIDFAAVGSSNSKYLIAPEGQSTPPEHDRVCLAQSRRRIRMNWLAALGVGVCSAPLTGLIIGTVAGLSADWLRMSTREGAAGFFIAGMALLGAFVGFVLGIGVARAGLGSAADSVKRLRSQSARSWWCRSSLPAWCG